MTIWLKCFKNFSHFQYFFTHQYYFILFIVFRQDFFSKDKSDMDELIIVQPNDPIHKIIIKEDDRTCEIEITKRGTFKGIIEKLYSSGKCEVRIIEKIQEAKE
jgi:hypothetical protein